MLDKKTLLNLRLQGLTYAQIAEQAKVSRQRVQQIIRPPTEVLRKVQERAESKCQHCGLFLARGHVHHKKLLDFSNFEDLENLEYLCIACHRKAHLVVFPKQTRLDLQGKAKTRLVKILKSYRIITDMSRKELAKEIGISVSMLLRMEAGTQIKKGETVVKLINWLCPQVEEEKPNG